MLNRGLEPAVPVDASPALTTDPESAGSQALACSDGKCYSKLVLNLESLQVVEFTEGPCGLCWTAFPFRHASASGMCRRLRRHDDVDLEAHWEHLNFPGLRHVWREM